MQPMSSMQTTLLPGVTPGWNDPPPLGNPAAGSRLNRYRRVVDPSLSAAGGSPTPYAASPQPVAGGMPMGVPHGMQQMQPVPYAQQPPPQQYVQPAYSMPGGGAYGDVPSHGIPPLQQQQQQPPPIQLPPQNQPPQLNPSDPQSPGPYPMSPYNTQHHHLHQQQQHHHQQQSVMTINYPAQYDAQIAAAAAQSAQMQKDAQEKEEAQRHLEYYSGQPASHSSPVQTIPTVATGVRFIAPNSVPGDVTPVPGCVAYVDRATYVPPMKAPGDVSLPPDGLRAFIIKAAMNLHDQKAQGVQLKIQNLMVDIGSLTKDDSFIKKFNYVVDFIDRNQLSEASRELDQLVADYPKQTRNPDNAALEKQWVGGIRFLLQELLKHPLG